MQKIYSASKDGLLLHILYRKSEIGSDWTNVSPADQYLQVSSLEMEAGRTFRPHEHRPQRRVTEITQESWVVVEGRVGITLYDVDGKIVHTDVLERGDCSITFRGGHTYEALADGTVVYEFKTGPYHGLEADKRFL